MKKKTKIALVIAVLLLVAGAAYAVYYFMFATPKPLKDKNGNTFQLTTSLHPDGPQWGYAVLVNGQINGALVSFKLGPDGLVEGINKEGKTYRYTTQWEQVA